MRDPTGYSYYNTDSFSLVYPIPCEGSLHTTIQGAMREALNNGCESFDVVTCYADSDGVLIVQDAAASVTIHAHDEVL